MNITAQRKASVVVVILTALGVVAVAGIAGFFLYTNVFLVKVLKDAIVPTNEAYEAYAKTMNKMAKYATTESDAETVEAIERNLQEGKDLLKAAESQRKELDEAASSIPTTSAKEYTKAVKDYGEVANKLADSTKQYVDYNSALVPSVKEIEDLTVSMGGVSLLMSSDPDKYVSEVQKIVNEFRRITGDIKKIKAPTNHVKEHENTIATLESMAKTLDAVKTGVQNRSLEQIRGAQQQLAIEEQRLKNESERISDLQKKDVKDIVSDLESAADSVKQSYSDLKDKYNI